MKKDLSSVTFMIISFVCGALAIFAMFIPLLRAHGVIYNCLNGFFNSGSGSVYNRGAWPTFIGYMLIVIATLGVGILALPVTKISYKGERLILLGSNVLLIVGIILILLMKVFWCVINECPENMFVPGYNLYPGVYITTGFALICCACNCYAAKLDA